jgi:hypothetical protein
MASAHCATGPSASWLVVPDLVSIVRDDLGFEHARSTDLELCRNMADELGVGAEVEIRFVVSRVTAQSPSDPSYDLFND